MYSKSIILISALLLLQVSADNWAVLVAGSNGFYNYRHQSDVCHAYKTLIKNGYDANHIITMAYDDIAQNRLNKFKGAIYNEPTLDGFPENVYEGCVLDYTGNTVTPQNFLYILRGEYDLVPLNHKVLNTTETDNIFIYFSDHGAPGLIAFPSSHLYEEDLTPVFIQMAEAHKFNKLVFYLEACESGSMFLNLPNNLNIYALSAANPTESSWGTFCPPDDLVDGYSIGTCLGDEFSVNFLTHTDKGLLDTTLFEQFEIIRDVTYGSHVMQWGDLSFQEKPLREFLWGEDIDYQTKLERSTIGQKEVSKWDSRDNKLLFYQNRFNQTQDQEDYIELQKEIESREYFDQKFQQLAHSMNLRGDYHFSLNQKCLKSAITIFENTCTKFTDYGLKYIKYLTEMCDHTNLLQIQLDMVLSKLCLTE